MSKVITGVIDLPFVNLKDTDTIYELLLFLQENGLIDKNWEIDFKENYVELKHKEKNWTWIKIYNDATIKYDNHYGITEEFKDKVLKLINEYYPMYKKTLEILENPELSQYNKKVVFDKEKEEICIEIEDLV